MRSNTEQGGGRGSLKVNGCCLSSGRNRAGTTCVSAVLQHAGHCSVLDSVGTVPSDSWVAPPLSTRTTLPRAMLTSVMQSQPGGGACEERQSGKASASWLAHSISSTGWPYCGPYVCW